MNFNWPIIGDKIFGILKGLGFTLQMFDKEGSKTIDPHEATRFFATIASNDPERKTFSILISVHDENRNSHVDIKTPDINNDQDFKFIEKLKQSLQRNIGEREGLSINWFKFDHAIQPKDDVVNNITESKDISKPYGTTKSSFQRIGNSKLIIRHTDSVNEEKKGSRWRHIKSIFVENNIGERLKYPHMHIAGARAMARHFANNGSMHDDIGEAIVNLSRDYMDLKKSAGMLRRAGDSTKTLLLSSALKEINKKVKKLSGPRGYATITDHLLEQSPEETQDVDTISRELLEICPCEPESSDANALRTAAHYLTLADKNTCNGIVFLHTPDLSSSAAEYPDQKQRLGWQVKQLAEAVANQDIRERLMTIADCLMQSGIINPDDIDTIKMVYRSSKGITDQPVTDDISRIRELSGI